MEQNKVKIYVASHKPDSVYSDDVYTPIHVGRKNSPFKEEMANMIGDDTGDNISEKNCYYSELTAEYWMWKNSTAEYVGLAHYRRYLKTLVTSENVDYLLGKHYDVMLCCPEYIKTTVEKRLMIDTSQEDVAIFFSSIKRVAPDYYYTALKYYGGNKVISFNMFVMKKCVFDKFAEWQFCILSDMEKYIKYSNYTRQKRVFGYFGETLLPIYCMHNCFKIKYVPFIWGTLGCKTKNTFIKDMLLKYYHTFIFKLSNPQPPHCVPAVKVGLEKDGIEVLMDE